MVKAGRVLRAEEERISKESRSERKKESLRREETVNLTTKSKSLLFVIMHSHRRGSPSSEGRRAYKKDDDQVWKLFRDGGALDVASLQKKDRAALIQRLKKLGSELHDYQHNMGLLLMERNDWTTNYKLLEIAAIEKKDKLKQEQSEHLISLTEAEKREKSLKRDLEAQKHRVYELEKSLHAMHSELEEIQCESKAKLVQAREMVVDFEQRNLITESALQEANVFLEEQNKSCGDAQRKLKELEAIEDALQKQHQSFDSEYKSYKLKVLHERQSLHAKEKKLQEGQEKLLEEKRLLDETGILINQREVALDQIEKDLMIAWKIIEAEHANLHKEEANLNATLDVVQSQERVATQKETNITKKEHELLALEERLANKEHVEIPRLIAKQKEECEAEKKVFEAEMERCHGSLEEELEKQKHLAELRADDIHVKERELLEKEKQLEKHAEKLKKSEKSLHAKLTSLIKGGQSYESEEYKIKVQNENLEKEREIVNKAKQGLEKLRRGIEEEKQQIQIEQEKLTTIEEEHNSLQSLKIKIMEEIDYFRGGKKNVINEAYLLKLEKESFDKDYGLLKEKTEQTNHVSQQVREERERMSKWFHDQEQRLKEDKHAFRQLIEMDAVSLYAKKEAFIENFDHEHAEWFAKYESEHNELVREFKMQRNELERNIKEKCKQIQKNSEVRDSEFEKRKEREMQDISLLRELFQKEMEELRLEREKHENRRREIAKMHEEAEMAWSEIKEDISDLHIQREKLQEQRESLRKEREQSLQELKGLHKLENDILVSINHLMQLEQQFSQENLEDEFHQEGRVGDIFVRITNLLEHPACLPLLQGLVSNVSSSSSQSKEIERLPKDASVNMIPNDKEYPISPNATSGNINETAKEAHGIRDSKCQDKSPFEPSFGGDNNDRINSKELEDNKLFLRSHSRIKHKFSVVEERSNVVDIVDNEVPSIPSTTGKNLVHDRMNSIVEENSQPDSPILLPANKKETEEGKSQKKRSRQSPLTNAVDQASNQLGIEPELPSGARRRL